MNGGLDPGLFETKSSIGNTFRCQILLILDASGSMNESTPRGVPRIQELGSAVASFLKAGIQSTPISDIAEVAVLAFNQTSIWLDIGESPVEPKSPFYLTQSELKIARPLTANGQTMLCPALNNAYAAVDVRTQQMAGTLHRRYKTQIYLISDGHLLDDPKDLSSTASTVQARSVSSEGDSLFFAFGVHGADFEQLKQLSPYGTYDLGDTSMDSVLQFVSASISTSIRGAGAASPTAALPGRVGVDPGYNATRKLPALNPLYRGFDAEYE